MSTNNSWNSPLPVDVSKGGTGNSSQTANAVIIGNTGDSAFQFVTPGTTGQVLTGVTGMPPTFQSPAASSISITGDTGGALTGNAFTFTGGTTGLTFAGATSTETLGGTLAIANGGTDATSFSTSTGIVKYDGTRLVSSSAAKIDSSNRMTNTSQPCFIVSQTGDQTDVTGDGTTYTVTFTSSKVNQGSVFDGTSTFTAPVTGTYLFQITLTLTGIASNMTNNLISLVVSGTSANTYRFWQSNVSSIDVSGTYVINNTVMAKMTASDTCTVTVRFIGGSKLVNVQGSTNAGYATPIFAGYLVC